MCAWRQRKGGSLVSTLSGGNRAGPERVNVRAFNLADDVNDFTDSRHLRGQPEHRR